MEKLVIAGKEFNSRLFLGTGKFKSNDLMEKAILASGSEMVTVAMKRIDLDDKEDDMLHHIVHPHIQLLPNTSGVRNAEEAVFAAQMAREAFGTNWLKLEIHPGKQPSSWSSWASLYYRIVRPIRSYAVSWKKPELQPLCRWVHLSELIKVCRHASLSRCRYRSSESGCRSHGVRCFSRIGKYSDCCCR